MKKIFTLLFSLGLLTTAFAQPGDNHGNQYTANTYQRAAYAGNNYGAGYEAGNYGGERNAQWNNKDKRGHDDNIAQARNDRDFKYANRNDAPYPTYKMERRDRDEVVYYPTVRVPLIQLVLGLMVRR